MLALAGVYVLKYQTETIADEKVAIQRDIAQQNTNLSVLRADWAYLSQPSHIEPIVIRHEDSLELKVISAKQYGSITDIPMRPQQVNDEALTRLLEALDAPRQRRLVYSQSLCRTSKAEFLGEHQERLT